MDMYTDEMGFKYQDFLHDLQVSWHLFAFVLFVFFLPVAKTNSIIYFYWTGMCELRQEVYRQQLHTSLFGLFRPEGLGLCRFATIFSYKSRCFTPHQIEICAGICAVYRSRAGKSSRKQQYGIVHQHVKFYLIDAHFLRWKGLSQILRRCNIGICSK